MIVLFVSLALEKAWFTVNFLVRQKNENSLFHGIFIYSYKTYSCYVLLNMKIVQSTFIVPDRHRLAYNFDLDYSPMLVLACTTKGRLSYMIDCHILLCITNADHIQGFTKFRSVTVSVMAEKITLKIG